MVYNEFCRWDNCVLLVTVGTKHDNEHSKWQWRGCFRLFTASTRDAVYLSSGPQHLLLMKGAMSWDGREREGCEVETTLTHLDVPVNSLERRGTVPCVMFSDKEIQIIVIHFTPVVKRNCLNHVCFQLMYVCSQIKCISNGSAGRKWHMWVYYRNIFVMLPSFVSRRHRAFLFLMLYEQLFYAGPRGPHCLLAGLSGQSDLQRCMVAGIALDWCASFLSNESYSAN